MKRYQDEPFVVLGVNTDGDRDEYRKKADEHQVTWRSAFQGSTSGHITELYSIRGYPTMHVIDASGKIRYMNVRCGGGGAEEAVETLLAELREQGGM